MVSHKSGKLVGRTAVGQRASGIEIGNDNRFFGIENLRRLPHEMDSAENDQPCRRCLGDARQSQRIADIVGQILNLGRLIVVGHDNGPFLFFQPLYLFDKVEVRVDIGFDIPFVNIHYFYF